MTEDDYQLAFQRFLRLPEEQLDSLDNLCDDIDDAVTKHYEIHGSPWPGRICMNRIAALMVLELALDYEKLNWEME